MIPTVLYLSHVVILVLSLATASVSGLCGQPQQVNDAEPTGINQDVEAYPAYSEVIYTCSRGYVKLRSEATGVSKCLPSPNSGKEYDWSVPDIECIPKQCHSPPKPDDGRIIGTDFTVGRTVSFECNHGYEMYDGIQEGAQRIDGSPEMICLMDSTWDGEVPACKPVKCPELESVKHASKYVTKYTYGGKVTYQCLEGFKFEGGDLQRNCEASGRWSGVKPRCKDIVCVDPDEDEFKEKNNIESVQIYSSTEPGHRATFVCRVTQKKIDSTCSNEGEWTNRESCIQVTRPTDAPDTPAVRSTVSTGVGSVSSTESLEPSGNRGLTDDITKGTISTLPENFVTSSGTETTPSDSSGLSIPEVIGISVGVILLVIGALGLGVVLYRRAESKRSTYRKAPEKKYKANEAEMKSLTPSPQQV